MFVAELYFLTSRFQTFFGCCLHSITSLMKIVSLCEFTRRCLLSCTQYNKSKWLNRCVCVCVQPRWEVVFKGNKTRWRGHGKKYLPMKANRWHTWPPDSCGRSFRLTVMQDSETECPSDFTTLQFGLRHCETRRRARTQYTKSRAAATLTVERGRFSLQIVV